MCGPSELSCGELKWPGLYTPASIRHQGGLPRKGVPLGQAVLGSLLYILKELTAGGHLLTAGGHHCIRISAVISEIQHPFLWSETNSGPPSMRLVPTCWPVPCKARQARRTEVQRKLVHFSDSPRPRPESPGGACTSGSPQPKAISKFQFDPLMQSL